MSMRLRLARLFTIKTRIEALFMTYAIALGALERGFHYLDQYPGYGGVLLALACLGVPFVAGAKLIDSVKPVPVLARARLSSPPRRGETRYQGGRPLSRAPHRGPAARASRRKH